MKPTPSMSGPTERSPFVPPQEPPGRKRAVALAVLAHLALGGLLYFGTQWRLSSDLPSFEAEVWSRVPQEAAPPATLPPPTAAEPEQKTTPEPEPKPEPPPAPPPPPTPAPVPTPAPEPPPPPPAPAPVPTPAPA
ncbi:MAG: hypothetical protein QM617_01290, partial [Comamonas sp.]